MLAAMLRAAKASAILVNACVRVLWEKVGEVGQDGGTRL
jgi:hypothetical protein